MITLYQRDDCPFCWKVQLAMTELQIEHQIVDIVLGEKHPQVLRSNPQWIGARFY